MTILCPARMRSGTTPRARRFANANRRCGGIYRGCGRLIQESWVIYSLCRGATQPGGRNLSGQCFIHIAGPDQLLRFAGKIRRNVAHLLPVADFPCFLYCICHKDARYHSSAHRHPHIFYDDGDWGLIFRRLCKHPPISGSAKNSNGTGRPNFSEGVWGPIFDSMDFFMI